MDFHNLSTSFYLTAECLTLLMHSIRSCTFNANVLLQQCLSATHKATERFYPYLCRRWRLKLNWQFFVCLFRSFVCWHNILRSKIIVFFSFRHFFFIWRYLDLCRMMHIECFFLSESLELSKKKSIAFQEYKHWSKEETRLFRKYLNTFFKKMLKTMLLSNKEQLWLSALKMCHSTLRGFSIVCRKWTWTFSGFTSKFDFMRPKQNCFHVIICWRKYFEYPLLCHCGDDLK